MSNVDDELRRALSEGAPPQGAVASEAGASGEEAAPGVSSTLGDEDGSSKRNIGLLLGLLVLGGGILSFVLGGTSDTMVYAKDVDTVLATWSDLGERNLRVQGVLVHGTLQKRDEPCEYRFKMENKDGEKTGTLDVRYASCIIPDTFRDVKGMPVEVTAEGTLVDEHLQAKHIFAKCPSKYEMQERQQAGEAAPHAMPGAAMGDELQGPGPAAAKKDDPFAAFPSADSSSGK